jgi:hypothetical protein
MTIDRTLKTDYMLSKYEIVFLAYKLSNYSFEILNKLNLM